MEIKIKDNYWYKRDGWQSIANRNINVEMTKNAYFLKHLCLLMIKEDDDKNTKEYIRKISNMGFNTFMIECQMIANVNRNEDDNFIVKGILSMLSQSAEPDVSPITTTIRS